MFSGIVETTTPVVKIESGRGQASVWLATPKGWRLRKGESVCVDGVCSTVQEMNLRAFQVIYMPETLGRSTLGGLAPSARVNLERSLTLGSLVGGHLVQGHVDTAARILKITPQGEARIFEFDLAPRFARYVAGKGSVAVDGISLTVVRARRRSFTVSVLAYTLTSTTLGAKARGGRVNIEFDVIAKYLERLLKR
ncbi:MAG: riboflavin synthase [Terriglobia bacterium]